LLRQEQHDAAIQQFRRALSLAPQHSGAQMSLARAHDLAGRTPEAIAEYRRALAMFPAGSQQAAAIEARLRELEVR
jgi:Flp pilus assembly protein TadD